MIVTLYSLKAPHSALPGFLERYRGEPSPHKPFLDRQFLTVGFRLEDSRELSNGMTANIIQVLLRVIANLEKEGQFSTMGRLLNTRV